MIKLFEVRSNRPNTPTVTMTSKDGVFKERIEYGKAFSNCSKELAPKIAYQKQEIRTTTMYNKGRTTKVGETNGAACS